MRKIDKILYQAILPPLLIALTVLTFVVFVHDFGRLSELVITHNASPTTVAMIAGTILPGILMFTLPLAYMVGILIGLSGLSGESQITALRACGVPLSRLLLPVLAIGAAVGIATGVISLAILPRTNDILNNLRDRISIRQATAQVQPRVFNEEFPNIVFYIDDLSADHQHWSRVFLVDNSDPKARRTVLAHKGTWISDEDGNRLQLHLENGMIYEIDPKDPTHDNVSAFASTDIPVDLSGFQEMAARASAQPKRPRQQDTRDLWQGSATAARSERRDQLIELHKRLAMPLSVLPFAFLGLTLGISTKKGGRASGFVLSLVLVVAFYLLFLYGIRLAQVDKVPPAAGAWGANVLLALLGALFMATAEQRNALVQRLSRWHVRDVFVRFSERLSGITSRPVFRILDTEVQRVSRAIVRFWFPKVLDLYVSRGFLVYFFWSIIVCTTLFVVLTLFDLLDDIIKNQIPAALVVSYFIHLMPQILMLVVPMAILLGILISFGILEKHSEITALKAGGWSLYRIGLPVFLISSVFCVSIYLLQEYVVPYANARQDMLHNIIKGRPPQTLMRSPRSAAGTWIIGESNRIYNYDYFDAGKNLFVGLNVFEIDMQALRVQRRIHAARAVIEGPGKWNLENGWVRDFVSPQHGFETISKAVFSFPEKAGYFQTELFQPKESSKFTYIELSSYISYLQKAGYNATELQVGLYKKISFPLSCLIMALLGVPFSFSTGKRGAFFGITASIAIAISYWGIFSIFEQMGSYGLLFPLLAAWAPDLLFGAMGLVLLLAIRT